MRKTLIAALGTIAWASSAQAMDYSYRLYKGHITIDASGVIEKDEPFHLINFIKTLPVDVRALLTDKKSGNAMVFNSGGGLVIEGLAIGVFIEQHHLTTGVAAGGECSSACVLAWAMGVRKSAAPDSRIGVHNATMNGEAGTGTADRLSSLGVTGRMG